MRALFALFAVVLLVGCTTPPTTTINTAEPITVRQCVDADSDGICDENQPNLAVQPVPVPEAKPVESKPSPVAKPAPVVEPVKPAVAPKPTAKPSTAKPAVGYFEPFRTAETKIILDNDKNKGGAVAASSDILAFLEFPDDLSVSGIDTFAEDVDDYDSNLIILGSECANGFTTQVYGTPCGDAYAEDTGMIMQFERGGNDILVITGADDTVVRNIVKLMVSGKVKNTGSRQAIDLADY